MDKIELSDGKYTVINELSEGGGFRALRYGEEWRDLAGDNLIHAMFCEIERLREGLSYISEDYRSFDSPEQVAEIADAYLNGTEDE